MDLKFKIGEKAGPFVEDITPEMVQKFSNAIGSSFPNVISLTFLTLFRKGEFELLNKFKIPLSKVLHGEQEYIYEHTLDTNDQVQYITTFTNLHEKTTDASSLYFLTFETVINSQKYSLPVGVSKTTIVLKDFTL